MREAKKSNPVRKIDAGYRPQFKWRSVKTVYGPDVFDRFANWSVCGNCVAYALTMSELLAQAGEGGDYMRLQMMEYINDGHATLWVETTDAGTVEIGSMSYQNVVPIVWHAAWREAVVRMDGKRKAMAFAGYYITPDGYEVFPVGKHL